MRSGACKMLCYKTLFEDLHPYYQYNGAHTFRRGGKKRKKKVVYHPSGQSACTMHASMPGGCEYTLTVIPVCLACKVWRKTNKWVSIMGQLDTVRGVDNNSASGWPRECVGLRTPLVYAVPAKPYHLNTVWSYAYSSSLSLA